MFFVFLCEVIWVYDKRKANGSGKPHGSAFAHIFFSFMFLFGSHYLLDIIFLFRLICCPIAFVYFGLLPVDSESPEAKVLIPYAFGVLDALEIKHGATHCEIMMTENGPCLVVRISYCI
jgi:hypothetical protein